MLDARVRGHDGKISVVVIPAQAGIHIFELEAIEKKV
jgi:hypothetical protein